MVHVKVRTHPENTSRPPGVVLRILNPALMCSMKVGVSPCWNGSIALFQGRSAMDYSLGNKAYEVESFRCVNKTRKHLSEVAEGEMKNEPLRFIHAAGRPT